MTRQLLTWRNLAFVLLVTVLVVLPQLMGAFFVNFVMTQTLILGLAAATIVFLAKYGGMISLAQLLLFGIAGFAYGNIALSDAARGLNLGWDPWAAVVAAIVVTAAIAFVLGAVASRTTGIYYLMLTLVYGVIGYFVFAQIVEISGPGGITSIARPDLMGPPVRLYYAALVLSVLAYVGFRYLGSSAFGLALQGIRDDPLRMASLGYNVALHRALAFTLGGFVAAPAGLLNVWWNGQIDPASIAIGPILILLIVAVIGGISYFEGAWIGALVYVLVFTYLRDLPFVDQIGITEARFNTVIGAVVLLIMVLSPEGLVGIFERLRGRVRHPNRSSVPSAPDAGSDQTSDENRMEAQHEESDETSGDVSDDDDSSVGSGGGRVQ
jgi:branched-chain amino acid transport system permease protein